jgi:hypothetical protein
VWYRSDLAVTRWIAGVDDCAAGVLLSSGAPIVLITSGPAGRPIDAKRILAAQAAYGRHDGGKKTRQLGGQDMSVKGRFAIKSSPRF